MRSPALKIDVNYIHSDHFAPQARPKIVKNDQNVSKIIEIGIIAENHWFGSPLLSAEIGSIGGIPMEFYWLPGHRSPGTGFRSVLDETMQ